MIKRKQLHSIIHYLIGMQISAQVDNQLYSLIASQLYKELDRPLRDHLILQVNSQIREMVL